MSANFNVPRKPLNTHWTYDCSSTLKVLEGDEVVNIQRNMNTLIYMLICTYLTFTVVHFSYVQQLLTISVFDFKIRQQTTFKYLNKQKKSIQTCDAEMMRICCCYFLTRVNGKTHKKIYSKEIKTFLAKTCSFVLLNYFL